MALLLAPSVAFHSSSASPSPLFGRNFGRIGGEGKRKPLPVEVVQQFSNEALEIYGQYNHIHKKMLKKEAAQHAKLLSRGFRSHADPSYQLYRSATVDWMCQVGEACRLGTLTIHSAVGFMDMFLDVLPVDGSRLRLVGAATLLIAAKIEEQEPNVPRVAALSAFCAAPSAPSLPSPFAPPASFVAKVESLILNHLNWEMVIVTPLHFLEYYLLASLLPSELLSNPHLVSNYVGTRSYLAKMSEFLLDLCEHHSLYREYKPSIVAAAAIATARQMLKVTPVWSHPLHLISSHSLAEISQCMANIWGHYRQSFAPLS